MTIQSHHRNIHIISVYRPCPSSSPEAVIEQHARYFHMQPTCNPRRQILAISINKSPNGMTKEISSYCAWTQTTMSGNHLYLPSLTTYIYQTQYHHNTPDHVNMQKKTREDNPSTPYGSLLAYPSTSQDTCHFATDVPRIIAYSRLTSLLTPSLAPCLHGTNRQRKHHP